MPKKWNGISQPKNDSDRAALADITCSLHRIDSRSPSIESIVSYTESGNTRVTAWRVVLYNKLSNGSDKLDMFNKSSYSYYRSTHWCKSLQDAAVEWNNMYE